MKFSRWVNRGPSLLHATVVSFMEITGVCSCSFSSIAVSFFFLISLFLLSFRLRLRSCTNILLSLLSVLAFGSHLQPFLIISFYNSTSLCPTVLSSLITGFLLLPLFCAFASSGSLWSLCSDGRGINATLEMIISLCSCSGVFFWCFHHLL